jgi:hypothetical protein
MSLPSFTSAATRRPCVIHDLGISRFRPSGGGRRHRPCLVRLGRCSRSSNDGRRRGCNTETGWDLLLHGHRTLPVCGRHGTPHGRGGISASRGGPVGRTRGLCRARNRRGAEPLHYAADANRWDPIAQADTIDYLISVGANPNALDHSGVLPLHRAVRTRSLAAVRALVDGGADSRRPNKAGSTPLRLAVQTTGRGGSGSPRAREQQAAIVRLLLERGARASDRDRRGKNVHQAATAEWIRALLQELSPG